MSIEVRLNDDGTIDEIVGSGSFQLEQMNDDHWVLCLQSGDDAKIVTLISRKRIKVRVDE